MSTPDNRLRILAGAAALLGLAVASAVALLLLPSRTQVSASPSVPVSGVVTSLISYPKSGVTLAPPSAGLVGSATLSAVDAWADLVAVEPNVGKASGNNEPEGKLALFTDAQHGKLKADGTVEPDIVDRLAWIYTVPNVPIPDKGPSASGTYPFVGRTASVMIVVDALSGSPILDIQADEFGR